MNMKKWLGQENTRIKARNGRAKQNMGSERPGLRKCEIKMARPDLGILPSIYNPEQVKCRKARFPAEQLDFPLSPASEIIMPLMNFLGKYAQCARFDQYQNQLWKLQGAMLRVLQRSDWLAPSFFLILIRNKNTRMLTFVFFQFNHNNTDKNS